MDKYNEIVVKNQSDKVSIQPEFVYLTIPAEWICIYHRLLVGVADLGKTLIDECSITSNNNSKILLNCWNLFQTAIAAKSIGKIKDAEFLIDYIQKQLELLYRGHGNIYNGTNYYPITEDGNLNALCSCIDGTVEFKVDLETGQLYEEYLANKNNAKTFVIEDDDLVVTSENKI